MINAQQRPSKFVNLLLVGGFCFLNGWFLFWAKIFTAGVHCLSFFPVHHDSDLHFLFFGGKILWSSPYTRISNFWCWHLKVETSRNVWNLNLSSNWNRAKSWKFLGIIKAFFFVPNLVFCWCPFFSLFLNSKLREPLYFPSFQFRIPVELKCNVAALIENSIPSCFYLLSNTNTAAEGSS